MHLHNFDFSKKILFHPEQLAAVRGGARPFPITLEVDLTNICNHDCSFCFYAEHLSKSNASLDAALLLERLGEAKELGAKGVYFTGGGEPMAHRDFRRIMERAREIGFDVGLMTNGSLIRPRNIDSLVDSLQWIRVSMAGGTRETYRLVQGRDHFDRVIGNLQELSDLKTARGSQLNVGVRALVNEVNLHSMVRLAGKIKGFAVDYLQVAPDHLRPDAAAFWESHDTQAVFDEAECILKPHGIKLLTVGWARHEDDLDVPRKCYAHHYKIALTAEGDLTFCNMCRGMSRFYLGNINEKSFCEIWNSDATIELESWIRPNNCGLFCKGMLINLTVEQAMEPGADMSPNFF